MGCKRDGVLFIVWLLLFSSCQTDPLEPDESRLGLDFFPLETGQYRIYDVEEIQYRITGNIDTIRYQLKEIVEDSMLMNNELTHRLHRFSRATEGTAWHLDSVWTARKNTRQVIVTESNVPYLKLVFPVAENTSWDGNSYNSKTAENYTMINISQPFALENISFDNSITVVHSNNQDTIISLDSRKEIFARNIGLIYKESLLLDYCAEVHCIGQGIIEQGVKYRQRLIDHGYE